MREIKFKFVFDTNIGIWITKKGYSIEELCNFRYGLDNILEKETDELADHDHDSFWETTPKAIAQIQYTGLKDKNGIGLTEVYERDIIALDGTLKGNMYEINKEETDIVIPQLGTKAWNNAYKEAVDRGYNYSE